MGPLEDMVPEMTRALAAALRTVPVVVIYGRERFERAIVTGNIIEIQQVGPERFGPSMGLRSGSDPTIGERTIAVEVLIEAKSDAPAAGEDEHKRLANWFADLVWGFFLEEGQERGQTITDGGASGGFVDMAEGETEVGARYVLAFSIGRAVKSMSELLSVDLAELGITTSGVVNVTSGNQLEVACGG